MFQEQYPHFERDSILKSEMLNNLREYPRDMFSLMYEDYSDGIITGVYVVVENKNLDGKNDQNSFGKTESTRIIIQPGIVKHLGKLYYMKEECCLDYEPTERNTVIKIIFEAPEIESDFTTSKSRIVLSYEEANGMNELELCRFLLKEGAKLRQDYQDISDFTTIHNTINRLYVPYASIGGTTITPEITHYYGEQLMNNNATNPYDIAFAMQCIQNKQIHRPLIIQYLRVRLGINGSLNNEQIHSCFVSILEEVQMGRSNRNTGMRTGRRVIVE